jgi:hypothetical protein
MPIVHHRRPDVKGASVFFASAVAKSVELCYTWDVLAAEKARLCGGSLVIPGGKAPFLSPDFDKGGEIMMISISDICQICLVVIAMIDLIWKIKHDTTGRDPET